MTHTKNGKFVYNTDERYEVSQNLLRNYIIRRRRRTEDSITVRVM